MASRLKRLMVSFAAFAAMICAASHVLASPPKVVATIKPIHALVAGVMDDVGSPVLLLKGAASPHHFALTPSLAHHLQDADMVFSIGRNLMPAVDSAIFPLVKRAKIISLSAAPGIRLLPLRENHVHKDALKVDDANAHHSHNGLTDPHFWLDPDNAKMMVLEISRQLSRIDAANRRLYDENARTLLEKLDELTIEITAQLRGLHQRPFIVFHDAFQYFETRFNLHSIGTITLSPETRPGAAHAAKIRRSLQSSRPVCVFSEVGAQSALIETLTENTKARTGKLDPVGAGLQPGKKLYFDMMRGITTALRDCMLDLP